MTMTVFVMMFHAVMIFFHDSDNDDRYGDVDDVPYCDNVEHSDNVQHESHFINSIHGIIPHKDTLLQDLLKESFKILQRSHT